jgi:hypothetical protein
MSNTASLDVVMGQAPSDVEKNTGQWDQHPNHWNLDGSIVIRVSVNPALYIFNTNPNYYMLSGEKGSLQSPFQPVD